MGRSMRVPNAAFRRKSFNLGKSSMPITLARFTVAIASAALIMDDEFKSRREPLEYWQCHNY